MIRDVLTVEPSDTIGEAAEKMHAANVGAVVVVEDMVRIIGIVTERDLLRAVAARIMFDHNFRHLPVVKDGRALGIVSLRLLARWAFEQSVQPA